MKLKLILVLVGLAGFAAAAALAAPTRTGDSTTTTATSTTTTTSRGDHHGKKHDDDNAQGDKKHDGEHQAQKTCQNVELQGSNGSGSVAFTVGQYSHKGSSLAGKQVTLMVPAGATVRAKACMDASGALTLREVKVDNRHGSTTTTTATTTTSH